MAPLIAPPLETSVLVHAHPRESSIRVMRFEAQMVIGRLGYGGRDEPGSIRLFDDQSSAGRHARLQKLAAGAVVRDMGSTNGTAVNGLGIREHLLRVGDEIRVGRSLIRFEHTLAGEPWPRDDAGLLAAIIADPGDNSLRSVFADWLLDRGDRRGNHVHAQLRGDQIPEPHEPALVAPLPVPVESWTLDRGLVSVFRVRDVELGERLRAWHPLARIESIRWG